MSDERICANCGRSEGAHTREKIIGIDAYHLLCDFYRGDPRKYGVRYFAPTPEGPQE
jgi:transcription elongation factor Elf1